MIESIATSLEVGTGVVWGLAGILALQLAVTVWALIDLVRRPRVRYDRKWLWALVIIFLGNSFLGPILYVAFGRNVPEEIDVKSRPGASGNGDRARRAVDTLYGTEDPR